MLLQVKSFIIRFSVGPQSPKDLEPAVCQASNGVAIGFAMRSYAAVVGDCPGRNVEGQFRPLLDDGAELMIAGCTEIDIDIFSTAMGEGAGACHRL